MKKTPKSLRLHIAIFGRANVGKSSFLNLIAGQDTAITSRQMGTTTDVVEKPMEFSPVGPVLFLDTAGLDDNSFLGTKRKKKTEKIFDQADIITLVTEPDSWSGYEERVVKKATRKDIPLILIINKTDIKKSTNDFIAKISKKTENFMTCSCMEDTNRDKFIVQFKNILLNICPEDFIIPPPLAGDLLLEGGIAVLIVPIDTGAPKGRLILPQVQVIRDLLDFQCSVVITKETKYAGLLKSLKETPDLIICDSQVVDKMVSETPAEILTTTFSIIFSRFKGDLAEMVKGAAILDKIKDSDTILIAEACSHHPSKDDIGRVKIPEWLREYTGKNPEFEVCSGKDYPENLKKYKLIIHCGGCMLNRKLMLSRIEQAKAQKTAITNYGVIISKIKGVMEKVLAPFPEKLTAYKKERF